MQKIEFKDYPDTSTLINAENLNTIQDNVEISINEVDNRNTELINEVDNRNTNLKNQVVNGWYQTGVSPTFTFVSWDSSVYTGVVNSNLDLTSYLSVGMKVKFTQSATVKFGIITAITSTQLTLFLGTDYSLNNSGISNAFYSMLKAPFGFPMDPDKWSFQYTNTSTMSQPNPVKDTWYNVIALIIPTGKWKVYYKAIHTANRSTVGYISCFATLSTDSTTATSTIMQAGVFSYVNYTSGQGFGLGCSFVGDILRTPGTTYYLNIRTTDPGVSLISLASNGGGTAINFVCAYL